MFERIVSGILVVCALVVTGLVVRREFFPPAPSMALPQQTVDDWQSYTKAGQRMGAANGRVTVVEFSDFQCPFCQKLAARMDTLRAKYPDEVTVIYRHYPLPELHPYARAAAVATECAARQGRFQALHDALYQRQDSIGKATWTAFAVRAQVPDTVAFNGCVRDSTTLARVQEDIEAGTRLGVTGTPGVLINDQFLSGAPTRLQLEALVEKARR